MKQPIPSPHAPGSDASIRAPAVLNDRVGALAPMQAGEPPFQPIQKGLIEKHFPSRKKRPSVVPARGALASKTPDPATLDCDNGHLGSFDELLDEIETWLSSRHAAVFGVRMNCEPPLIANQVEASDGAPPL